MLRAFSTSSSGFSHPLDVLIVGGGMVGMSLAAALGRSAPDLSIAVVDRAAMADCIEGGLPEVPGQRVSTLTAASIRFLSAIGAWEDMQPYAQQFSSMQVWDHAAGGYLRWNAKDVGADSMGAVVENRVIQCALWRAAKRTGAVQMATPATVHGLELDSRVAANATATPAGTASGSSGATERATPATVPGALARAAVESRGEDAQVQEVQARLVVAADGPGSPLRRSVGLRTVGLQYEQRGVVATVRTEGHSTAWQRFLPNGPLALLPVRDGFSNIVWSTTNEEAELLCSLTPEQFTAAVNDALHGAPTMQTPVDSFGPFLRAVRGGGTHAWQKPPRVLEQCGEKPAAFPLKLQHAGRYTLSRFALIGDAAHTVHPLAGQGVNLGFGDAECLASAVCEAHKLGRDFGSDQLLQDEYDAPRRAANVFMMGGLHVLQRTFQADSSPVAMARNIGMDVINVFPVVRDNLMRVAMGDVPHSLGRLHL